MRRNQSIDARRRARGARLSLALLIAGAVCAYAQYQVNMQLNTELYGRGVGTIRYNNQPFIQPALRSDIVHDTILSGAIRSDVRSTYLQQGPIAPYGAISYVPYVARPYGDFQTTLGRGALPPTSSPYSSYRSSPPSLPTGTGGSVKYGTLGAIGTSGVRQPYNSYRTLNLPGVTSPMSSRSSYGTLRYGR